MPLRNDNFPYLKGRSPPGRVQAGKLTYFTSKIYAKNINSLNFGEKRLILMKIDMFYIKGALTVIHGRRMHYINCKEG